jgi:hypothetical protein
VQFIKDFLKLLCVLLALVLIPMSIAWLMGGTNNDNTIMYHLYEYHYASDEVAKMIEFE